MHTAQQIGSGSGLLEEILRRKGRGTLNIYGVEVASCANLHLPEHRMLRVPSTSSLCSDAILASSLLFVYPRHLPLVENYINTFTHGALRQVVVVSHLDEKVSIHALLRSHFDHIELSVGAELLPEYEFLAVASSLS